MRSHRSGPARLRAVGLAAAVLFVGATCTENLPSGPENFSGVAIKIVVPHDTIVVGDSSTAQAQAFDSQGRAIQSLNFNWTTATPTVLDFSPFTTDSSGRSRTFVGKFPGRSAVTLALPDTRFVTTNVTRNETVVVGGVRISTTHDSTLTAVNDTVRAIAAGLVRVNGAMVTKVSQGVRWVHLGSHTAIVGTGDTIRYISRTNGADTLIATHDFCLVGAKCADTAVIRVSQQVSLALSSRVFTAWSFADTVGPTIALTDRRGNGLPGATIRFVPQTALDSQIVKVAPATGTSNPNTGVMAAPKLVSSGNGTARVLVQAIGPDGNTVAAVDSLQETVRQVARRVQVEPLRAAITSTDSIPIKPVARDARGAIIADATITLSPSGIPLSANGLWAGPAPLFGPAVLATITPTLSGNSLPSANPLAPQVPVIVDPAQISIFPVQTVTAGATTIAVSGVLLDSLASPAFNKWLRLSASFGPVPDSVVADGNGIVNILWTPRDSAATYTLTGVRGAAFPLLTLADSAGRIAIRTSVVVQADIPSPIQSSVTIAGTSIPVNTTRQITVTVKDRFGNPVKNASLASFAITTSAGRGTTSGGACSLNLCTLTYTAPATAGADVITVTIGGVNVIFSPISLTITP